MRGPDVARLTEPPAYQMRRWTRPRLAILVLYRVPALTLATVVSHVPPDLRPAMRRACSPE